MAPASTQPRARARIARGESAGSRWEVATRAPAPGLRGYVRDFMGYSEATTGLLRRTELPGPQVVVIFEFGPPIRVYDLGPPPRPARYPGGFVAGLSDRGSLTEHDGFQHGLQVNLTPLGGRLFFGVPMSELTGRVVGFRDLVPGEHRSLAERLEALPSWDARLDLIERMIGERIAATRLETRTVAWAVQRIESSGGALDLRALARASGYSQKHVIDLFHAQVGVTPKLLARIVRFDRLVQRLRAGARASWSELALELGYYDQAHLANDVKRMSGQPPTALRASLVDLAGLPEAPG